VLIKTTASGWEGGQYVARDYHRLQLVYRGNDPARGSGMSMNLHTGFRKESTRLVNSMQCASWRRRGSARLIEARAAMLLPRRSRHAETTSKRKKPTAITLSWKLH
jgi:hypothetical protein